MPKAKVCHRRAQLVVAARRRYPLVVAVVPLQQTLSVVAARYLSQPVVAVVRHRHPLAVAAGHRRQPAVVVAAFLRTALAVVVVAAFLLIALAVVAAFLPIALVVAVIQDTTAFAVVGNPSGEVRMVALVHQEARLVEVVQPHRTLVATAFPRIMPAAGVQVLPHCEVADLPSKLRAATILLSHQDFPDVAAHLLHTLASRLLFELEHQQIPRHSALAVEVVHRQ